MLLRRPDRADQREAIRDLSKDLDLALEAVDEIAAPTPLTRHVRDVVAENAATNPALEITAVAKLYRAAR